MAKIAIVATNGFEYSELTSPKKALEEAGHETTVLSIEEGEIEAAHDAGIVAVDHLIEGSNAEDFDGLVLPGGVGNPDILRTHSHVVAFIRHFIDADKPVASICHGPWTLIEADAVAGKKVTSWPSLKTDLENAGAHWVDEEVVVDGKMVTSRNPNDLPAFNQAFLGLF